jgi:hypothetical protein
MKKETVQVPRDVIKGLIQDIETGIEMQKIEFYGHTILDMKMLAHVTVLKKYLKD